MTMERTAVLLMAYGGPLSLDDVEPYLLDVRGGRPTPPELIEEVRERYALIGGQSPLLAWTQRQARALEGALRDAYPKMRVFVGMRHWHPYIREVVPEMVASGVEHLVAIPMAPHYSKMSVGAYRKALEEALAAYKNPLRVSFVERWGTEPAFVEAVAENVRRTLERFPAEVRPSVAVVFTAHSLPRRVVEMGDPYPIELEKSSALVAEAAGVKEWLFAYQSAGASSVPWLGPDVGEVVQELAEQGREHVLVVPIGFVCDHVEILYDIDIELKGIADRVGVHLERTPSLNDSPGLIRALKSLVERHLTTAEVQERDDVRA